MVHKITAILHNLVKMHVDHINISPYKMEIIEKLVGVVVIMNYLMLLCMVQPYVDQLEVLGVIMFGKIINTQLHYLLHHLLIFLDILTN